MEKEKREMSKLAKEINEKYGGFSGKSEAEVIEIRKKETGIVFSKVLEHAGVYKCNEQGIAAFEKFIAIL